MARRDKIKKYEQILKKELEYQASIPFANAPKLERHVIIDQDNKHFMLMLVGWNNETYKHYALFHFEIKNNKIWVHQNNSNIDLAAFFMENDIPKSDIVIGFLMPEERVLSDYAIV